MSYKPDQQQLAKDLYLHTLKTQQEIADILDVNRRTIYLWIKNGRWEEMKIAARQAPRILVQNMYNHIDEINNRIFSREPEDRCPTMQEVEMLRKLVGITNTINKKHAGAYIESFEELICYISRNDRELSQKVIRHADNYVKGNFGDESFHLTKQREENVNNVIDNIKKDYENASPFPPEDTAMNPAGDPVMNPPERSASCDLPLPLPLPLRDTNGIFCDSDAIISPIVPQPVNLPGNVTGPDANQLSADEENPTNDFLENETMPVRSTEPADCSNDLPLTINDIISMPPEKRPSPFRDGNIIWVNDIDDVEKRLNNFGQPWGELKMADVIRRYSSITGELS